MQHLREDGVSAGADVLRAAANAEAAVGAELDAGGAGKAHGPPACAGASPPENLAIAMHPADGRGTLSPAGPLRAPLQTPARKPRPERDDCLGPRPPRPRL